MEQNGTVTDSKGQKRIKQDWSMKDYMGPNGTKCHMEPYETLQDHRGLNGAILGHTGPNTTIRGHTGPYEQYGTKQDQTGLNRTKRDQMGP